MKYFVIFAYEHLCFVYVKFNYIRPNHLIFINPFCYYWCQELFVIYSCVSRVPRGRQMAPIENLIQDFLVNLTGVGWGALGGARAGNAPV